MTNTKDPEVFFRLVALRSWDVYKNDALLLTVASLIVFVGSIFSLGLLAGPLIVGYYRLTQRRLRGESAELGDVFSGFSSFVPALLCTLLVSVAMVVGFALLVVPGMLVMVVSQFALHAIAYRGVGSVEALRQSFELVKENFLNALLLIVALALINTAAGMVVLVTLVTAPLSAVALTVAYEELSGLS